MGGTGLSSCSFCPLLVVSGAGEGGMVLAAAPQEPGDEQVRKSSYFVY